MRQRQAVLPQGFIPLGFDNTDLWIADRLDHGQRLVGRARNIDDHFVAQRQQRASGRNKRIAQFDAVAYEREPADFHALHLSRTAAK